jgi:hypothetical protein
MRLRRCFIGWIFGAACGNGENCAEDNFGMSGGMSAPSRSMLPI